MQLCGGRKTKEERDEPDDKHQASGPRTSAGQVKEKKQKNHFE